MLTFDGHAPILGDMSEQVDYAEEPELTLGWRLQMALHKGGLKQTDLMDKFEVSRQTVSRWCNDVGAKPKKFILNEIAVMCHVSPRWLIDGVSYTRPPDGGGSRTSYPVGYICPPRPPAQVVEMRRAG